MSKQEEIDTLLARLSAYRATLQIYLKQLATLGNAYAPPAVFHGIGEARQNIQTIKQTLRSWNEQIEDLPDDQDIEQSQDQGPTTPKLNDRQYNELVVERNEIRALLVLFERAAFRPYDEKNAGDPTAAFNSIQATRIALQKRGASLLSDPDLAQQFRDIQDLLWELETAVGESYPAVVQLAAEWRNKGVGTSERTQEVQNKLGSEQYQESAIFMRAKAYRVYFLAQDISEKLRAINQALSDG